MFLSQDAHWAPEGLGLVADALAERVGQVLGPGSVDFTVRSVGVSNRGDLYDMLDLPDRETYLAPQSVQMVEVIDPSTGQPVAPDPSSPVVLLGDSCTNIYSMADMG